MRGKDVRGVVQNVLFGITPAYAGKSTSRAFVPAGTKDHPRICGEKNRRIIEGKPDRGSPPHMRGKEDSVYVGPRPFRITPAYAGKSILCPVFRPIQRDHPRICGEKATLSSTICDGLGSPPHMRGKGDTGTIADYMGRITPAYAGKRVSFRAGSQ